MLLQGTAGPPYISSRFPVSLRCQLWVQGCITLHYSEIHILYGSLEEELLTHRWVWALVFLYHWRQDTELYSSSQPCYLTAPWRSAPSSTPRAARTQRTVAGPALAGRPGCRLPRPPLPHLLHTACRRFAGPWVWCPRPPRCHPRGGQTSSGDLLSPSVVFLWGTDTHVSALHQSVQKCTDWPLRFFVLFLCLMLFQFSYTLSFR